MKAAIERIAAIAVFLLWLLFFSGLAVIVSLAVGWALGRLLYKDTLCHAKR